MSESKVEQESRQEETSGAKERFAIQTAVSRWIASGKKKPESLRCICEILAASKNSLPELIKMIREGSGSEKG